MLLSSVNSWIRLEMIFSNSFTMQFSRQIGFFLVVFCFVPFLIVFQYCLPSLGFSDLIFIIPVAQLSPSSLVLISLVMFRYTCLKGL